MVKDDVINVRSHDFWKTPIQQGLQLPILNIKIGKTNVKGTVDTIIIRSHVFKKKL